MWCVWWINLFSKHPYSICSVCWCTPHSEHQRWKKTGQKQKRNKNHYGDVDGCSEVGCSIQYENPNKNEIEIITAIERVGKKTYRSILSRHLYTFIMWKKHESLFLQQFDHCSGSIEHASKCIHNIYGKYWTDWMPEILKFNGFTRIRRMAQSGEIEVRERTSTFNSTQRYV